jgi:hypothetical protein
LLDGSGSEENEEIVEEEPGAGEGEGEGDGAGEGEGDQGGEEEQPPGRQPSAKDLPMQVRKAMRAMASADPNFAKNFPGLEKSISTALFKVNAINRLGGVQKFQEFTDLLDAHGGADGIAALAEEVEAGRDLERGFEQGDPAVIDGWAKDYPAGFKALVGPALAKLEQMDQAGFDQAISSPMLKTLDRCGVLSVFSSLENALASKNYEQAGKDINAIKGFFADLRKLSSRANSPDPLKADRDKITAEREEIQGEKNKVFYGGVRQEVNGQVTAAMNRMIRQELGSTKIRLDTANRLRKEINAELARIVNTSRGYAERYKAVMGGGDHDRAVRFIVSNAVQKLPAVVKQLVREFNLKKTAPANAGNVRRVENRSGGGNNTVSGVPKTSEVDFRRTDKARWLVMKQGHGEAWLLNGKLAKW